MNNFYTLSDFMYSTQKNSVSTDTHLYGHAWESWIDNDICYLQYISGELAGRVKKIQISLQEFENLKLGTTTTIDLVLLAHDAY